MKKETKRITVLTAVVCIIFVLSYIAMGKEDGLEKDLSSQVTEEVLSPEINEETDQNVGCSSDGEDKSNHDSDEVPFDDESEATEPSFEAEDLTVLLIGQDFVEGMTDVIMVGHLDADAGSVKVVSVPRDFYINFREEPFKSIRANSAYPTMPLDQKLTEVFYNQYRTDQALFVVRDIVSGIIGTEIDYFAVIDTGGFREIVDLAGGVEIYVPNDMDKEDPLQGLKIHLKEGLQVLDGDKAEQFVRFRGYAWGDLDRIENQQAFVEAFVDQVIIHGDADNLMKIASKGYSLIKSDFGLALVLDYLNYFTQMDFDVLVSEDNMMKLQMSGVINISGREALTWDMERAHQDVEDLFFGSGDEILD